MHSILWASLLASAGVAAITTLIIEYAAKPWLEARKERILETNRDRRDAVKNLRRIVYLSGRLSVYRDIEVMPSLEDHVNRMLAAIEPLMEGVDGVFEPPEIVEDAWGNSQISIMNVISWLQFGRQPIDEEWNAYGIARDLIYYFAEFFSTSMWNMKRRRALTGTIKIRGVELASVIKQIHIWYERGHGVEAQETQGDEG